MTLGAALETGTTGLWYGRIVEFLGTNARSGSRDKVLSILDEELTHHIEWLKRHGETPQRLMDLNIEVVEEVKGLGQLGESGGEVALFNYDLKLVSEQLLNECLRLMSYNRSDLLSQVEGLSAESMSYVPPTKKRSITQILHHVCNAEEFYVSRLGSEAETIYESKLEMSVGEADKLPVSERLDVVRHGCIETLRQIVPIKEAEVFTRAEYTNYPAEKWTAHKVMRRFLEHEREHIYNVREYLGLPPRLLNSM